MNRFCFRPIDGIDCLDCVGSHWWSRVCVPEETAEDMEELFEIRSVLEGQALSSLCNTISDDDFFSLNHYIEQAESAAESGDLELVFTFNTKFHDLLNGLIKSKKPRLYNLIEDMREYVLRYRKSTLENRDAARRSISGHRKIVMALELKDPVLCEHIMRAHINEAKEDTGYSLAISEQPDVSHN